VLLGLLASCVAGSEGPTGTGGPSDPEPGLQADLSAGPIEVPDEIRVDSILEMTIGVRNGGTTTAEAGWIIRVMLSTDSHIDSADIQIDHFSAPRVLLPGAEDQYQRHKKLRRSTPTGPYFVGSILDVTGRVAETSEANNTLRFPVPVVLTSRQGEPPQQD
jgi:CARDB